MFSMAIISAFLIKSVLPVPIDFNVFSQKQNYALALDVNAATNIQTFRCLNSAGYQTAFVRIYTGAGTFDPNGPSNLLNAHNGKKPYH